MDTAGPRHKLSDISLDEMAAFSRDRGKRRAAVRRILTDRGLGHVAPSLTSKFIGVTVHVSIFCVGKTRPIPRISGPVSLF